MTPIERATQAIIAELHRQAKISGCCTEDNGKSVQVDGPFKVEPLARAVLKAIGEPGGDKPQ